ncbi:hypothetical protein [Pseudomonas sp. Marseille-Q8238]
MTSRALIALADGVDAIDTASLLEQLIGRFSRNLVANAMWAS